MPLPGLASDLENVILNNNNLMVLILKWSHPQSPLLTFNWTCFINHMIRVNVHVDISVQFFLLMCFVDLLWFNTPSAGDLFWLWIGLLVAVSLLLHSVSLNTWSQPAKGMDTAKVGWKRESRQGGVGGNECQQWFVTKGWQQEWKRRFTTW